MAKDFLSKNELGAARLEATKALELDGGNSEAHSILGLVAYLEALNDFRLLEVDNCLTGVDAERLRQEMDEHLGMADKAFARAVEIDPEYSEAIANRGNVAMLLGRYANAVSHFEQALKIPHRLLNLGLTRANMGWARFHLGDDVGAAKDLRQALQFNPAMCVGKYRLGRVYFAREEWNKAYEQFQEVATTDGCPLQEADLYLVKTMNHLGDRSGIPKIVERCLSLASSSCIAAQCEAQL